MRIEMQLRQTIENQIKINFTNNKISTTKCTKMTEESDTIRNGMSVSVNGGGATQNGASGCNSKTSSTGGRLQFFKDGKFILELASARENENGRTAWVAVPRKTFWPPTAPPFTNNFNNTSNCSNNKNESSTSLSFSDDNSSIQSSPWQRDHCWKQLTPRRNISQEMSMLYVRPVSVHLSREGRRLAKVKKRRPYDVATSLHKIIFTRCHNGVSPPSKKSDETITDKDCTDAAGGVSSSPVSAESAAPTEKKKDAEKVEKKIKDEVDTKMDEDDEVVHTVKTMKTVKILKNRIPLSTIVQKLMDRLPTGLILLTKTPALVANHHFSAASTPKVDNSHQHVSPRKRILREFERVSLDDTTSQTMMKRHRTKNSNNTVVVSSTRSVATAPAFQQSGTVPSATATVISKTVIPNGSGGHEPSAPTSSSSSSSNHDAVIVTTSSVVAAVSKPISSYSIISLLGHNNNSKSNDKNPSTSHAKEHEPTPPPTSPSAAELQSRLPPKKKQSPPYGNNNWSPKPSSATTTQRSNSSPSSNVGSPSSHNYNLMRSPDLSPSPEQQHSLSRYKSHYSGLHYSGSGGTATGSSYHPYLTARGSPSGTSSPSSETFNNSRYRSSSSYISGSPQHNRANNNSPSSLSPYSRYSPIPTTSAGAYPPVSPQHFGTKGAYYNTTTYNSNNRLRSTSPCRSPSEAHTSSHKKTAHSSKAYRSPVASPHDTSNREYMSKKASRENHDRLTEDDVKMSSLKDVDVKREATTPDNERSGLKLSSQEMEYLAAFSKANSHPLLSGIDMAFAAMIRPSPYLMYPPTHSGSSLHHHHAQATPPGVAAYLPGLPFYNPMYPAAAAAAAAYRQQSWLNYPPIPSASRLPSASLLAYDAAASGLGPPAPSAASPSSSTTPWGSLSHNHGLPATEASALDRIKDEPGSDVPLNLSKH